MKNSILIYFFLLISINSFCYEKYNIPFTNLPKKSIDGKIEFVKVLKKTYFQNENKENYINYIFFVSKDNISGLFVKKITDRFIFYENLDSYGQIISSNNLKNISIFIENDKNGDYLINLKNVPESIFRLTINVDVVYNGIEFTTILEFTNPEMFPKKTNNDLFFDKQDFSIGKMVVIEK